MATASPSRDMRWLILAIAALVVGLDRATKLWIISHIQAGHAIVIIPRVFRLTHVLNTGAAFSMFEGSASPNLVRNLLIGFSVVAVIVVLVLIWKMGRGLSLTSVALALILGERKQGGRVTSGYAGNNRVFLCHAATSDDD